MKHFAIFAACLGSSVSYGQLFRVLPEGPGPVAGWQVEGPRPTRGAVTRVGLNELEAALTDAPAERVGEALRLYGMVVTLPSPSGEMLECVVARSAVMEDGLAARHPEIRTYIVQALDGRATGRMELTGRGVTAMLRSAPDMGAGGEWGSVWMIDPWLSGDPDHAVSYWLRDLPGGGDWRCETTEGVHGFGEDAEDAPQGQGGVRGGQVLRTVRMAMACTGEYGVHQSMINGREPNVDDPLAAIVTVIARTNVVFENDLGVRFTLVENNDQIVYFDPATDPYPDSCDGTGGGDCSGPYLAPNIENLANVIGNENFDIGHLLTRVYGGVAYLSSVCGTNKAGGISGIPRGGDVDPLSALVVIHEIGHQFGANHTFSGTRGRCAGNVRLQSAWEAGSGSSPMAYAGGCPVGDEPPSDNVAIFADPFFHHGSFNEMRNFLNGNRATCIAQSAGGNEFPVIESRTGSIAVPPGTPFVLSAVATDVDGDMLTYSWEQFDNDVARPLSGPDAFDNGDGALFRVFPPTASGSRTFPRMEDVLAGTPTPGEMLPTVTGVVRRFRVIVRDNHPGVGASVVSGFTDLTIASGTSAFIVTRPVAGDVLTPGKHLVEWSTGNTQNSPISCATVRMRLSGDGGATFPIDLGSFPNTGSATVVLPGVPGEARLKIEGEGEIFFAVSGPFASRVDCAADINADGAITSQDFFDFLGFFFEGDPAADINDDGSVTSQDFFDFITLFFGGC